MLLGSSLPCAVCCRYWARIKSVPGHSGEAQGVWMNVAELTDGKCAICRRVLDALPEWFGIEEAKENYIREADSLPMFGCLLEEKVVGFVTLRVHNAKSAEIHLIGILPDHFRKGIGTRLVRRAEEYARERDVRFLSVKTLAPGREDANYEGTRKFYEAVGFEPLMELPNIWGPDNPCVLMLKQLGKGPSGGKAR